FGCLLLRCFSLYQVSAWLILHPFHLACSDRGKRQEAPQHFSGSCLLPAVRLFLHSSELPAIIPLYQWRLYFSRVVCWRLGRISCWQVIRDKLGWSVFNKKALGLIPTPFK